jgi:hypothetical protein
MTSPFYQDNIDRDFYPGKYACANCSDGPRPMGYSLPRFVVFQGERCVATGDLAQAAAACRELAGNPHSTLLVFNTETGNVVDLDLRGTEQEVTSRYVKLAHAEKKRGRPKLGIVAREVTLLPRHWEWLARQPGGASAAIRRLVEVARKTEANVASYRTEAAYRFMSAIAGDLPGFEEAARALFANDQNRLVGFLSRWPPDIHRQVLSFLDGDWSDRET